MSAREQLQHRIGRYLENGLSDEERQQLESLLSRSEPARRELLTMSMLHQELFELATRTRRFAHRPRPQRPSRWPWMVAAAVLLVSVGVALFRSEPAPRVAPKEVPVARPPEPKVSVPEPPPPPPPTITPVKPEVKPAVPPAPVPPEPEPAPPPPPPPAPAPKPPKPVPATIVAIATFDQVEGQVKVGGEAVQAGTPLASGQGLQTLNGRARLRFKDGTILDVDRETEIREISDVGGKRVSIVCGEVAAEVARQDQPMIFTAPHGETTVLGTSIRLIVEGASTRLQVLEGKARLKRVSDGKQVDVPGGKYALIAAGSSFAARPMPRNLLSQRWRTGPNHNSPPKVVRAGRSGSQALETSLEKSVCDLFQEVPVKAGVEYQAAAWVKTQDVLLAGRPGGAVVRLIWMDALGKVLLRQEVGMVGSTQGWTRCGARLRAPDQASTVRFQLFAEDGSGTVCLEAGELFPLER